MLGQLLETLEFYYSNETHLPVLDALAIVKTYAVSRLYVHPLEVRIPKTGVALDLNPGCWSLRALQSRTKTTPL
jgi:hypothetical protein